MVRYRLACTVQYCRYRTSTPPTHCNWPVSITHPLLFAAPTAHPLPYPGTLSAQLTAGLPPDPVNRPRCFDLFSPFLTLVLSSDSSLSSFPSASFTVQAPFLQTLNFFGSPAV